MFDKLYEVSKDTANGAAHYANRCLKHRRNLEKVNPNLPPWAVSEPSIEEKRLAVELLKEIEQIEQTPIRLLPQEKTDEYIGRIARISLDRSAADLTEEDRAEGRRILEEMRKDPIVWMYPLPGQKVSVPPEYQKWVKTPATDDG
jgi:hypothetical protein